MQREARESRLDEQSRVLDNALLWSVAVTVALSILAFCALALSRDPGEGDSVVAVWVAGVAMTLVLGPCLLCTVLAHRDMRLWWAPISVVVISALLVVSLFIGLN